MPDGRSHTRQQVRRLGLAGLALAAVLPGCIATPPPRDGQLPLPPDYRTWSPFLHEVQRPDNRQVRDIYVNAAGQAAVAGSAFPYGTVLVMENHKAVVDASGAPARDGSGRLVKGDLAAIFVMGKGRGWGSEVPAGLATGEWIFAAYQPDGRHADTDLSACRSCHAPLGTKDFIHRYDEYFASRSK